MREQRVCANFLDGRSRRLYLCRNVVPPYSPTHRSSMDNSSRLVARSPYASMDMNTELLILLSIFPPSKYWFLYLRARVC